MAESESQQRLTKATHSPARRLLNQAPAVNVALNSSLSAQDDLEVR
jgi:hypothetical protein